MGLTSIQKFFLFFTLLLPSMAFHFVYMYVFNDILFYKIIVFFLIQYGLFRVFPFFTPMSYYPPPIPSKFTFFPFYSH